MAGYLAIAFTALGVAIWGYVLRWGPCFGYLDLETRRRLLILAGAACFAAAGMLAIWHAAY